MGSIKVAVVLALLMLGTLLSGLVFAHGDPTIPLSPPPTDPVETLTRMFAPYLLPPKLQEPQAPLRCGVEVTAMVAENWHRLSPEVRAQIPDYLRPLEYQVNPAQPDPGIEVCDAYLDSEHFRIHYSTDPEFIPPGYPDLQKVRDLAAHLETAYVYHRDVSGMGVALTDSANGGGMNLYDCYFYEIDSGLFGRAHPDQLVNTHCYSNYWGYISVTTDFSPQEFDAQLRLTSEHEYYHLLQYSHNANQYTWIKESTARNSEFHVWPELAAPRGILGWMRTPYLTLWNIEGLRDYAPHMWFYLERHYGYDFTTRMWDSVCRGRAEDFLVDELQTLGTSIDAVLTDFAIWNYFAGQRDDGRHYDPDQQVPAVYYQAAHSDFPVATRALNPNHMAQPTGSNYIRFNGPPIADNLHLTVDGQPELAPYRVVTILGVNEWGHRAWTLTPDSDGDVDFTVPDWGLYDHVTLIVTNFWDAPSDSALIHYTYAAEAVSSVGGPEQTARLVASAPNPFTDVTRVVYFAPQDGAHTIIRVYDVRGSLVRTLTDESSFAGNHQVVWDGKDQGGRSVPTGVYFLKLADGSSEDVRKVIFVR